ncbi:ketopantoate reductase family protein [Anaerocolumna sp. MB42-C2]|uniref:ketopantoate reductase family protein n=1 Tax=Anaerocolumna sp. MB42-C2 TaxID=3070997 RepID=UPI0027E073A3|nr:2-dehydropantoate 2-reductase N-terminal domain-containing protein [Anaerocolumna sp. MB42-C2]WMJ90441.1 2-dehydropantoate 2-reductase N-terminal domain-containing protein [Anaerocolumna sp. MB42-C2]
MKILVYGAGVLGCNLAHLLYKSQKNVTLLARGSWYEDIKQNGVTIRHKFRIRNTNDKIPVINSLTDQDIYDVIFVALQYTQLDSIISILNQNLSKNIVFIGNNINAKGYIDLLKEKNVLFGFFSAGGKRNKKYVDSFYLNEMTIGRTDNSHESDEWIKSIFQGTKMRLTIQNKMDDWLKSHVAFILPFVYTAYYTEYNYRKIKNNKTILYEIIDSVREYYDALIQLGYEVLSKSDYQFVTSKKIKCYMFLKLCCYTALGDLCVCDHAKNGKNEMIKLNSEFRELISNKMVETPHADFLEKYIPYK